MSAFSLMGLNWGGKCQQIFLMCVHFPAGAFSQRQKSFLKICNSKIIINGDPSQIDLPNKSMSGLARSKKILGGFKEISVVDFDHTDVVRHPLVSKIVKAYSDQNNNE